MIGVIADPKDQGAAREFFELFKTPWEFYRDETEYDVLLYSGDEIGWKEGAAAKLVVVYAGREVSADGEGPAQVTGPWRDSVLLYRESRLPIYGQTVGFEGGGVGMLTCAESKRAAAYLDKTRGTPLVRIGYDLFLEVHTLLSKGQPPEHAGIPTMELHVELLRSLIVGRGISLVEIPPIPDGHGFTVCLTHDVDHPAIRHHKGDHTMWGFVCRALVGSVIEVFRRRMTVSDLLSNWTALMKLPLVYLGLAKDFWCAFERYLQIEGGRPSTFFVIPFRNCQGTHPHGKAPRFRASKYGAQDIAEQLRRLKAAGCEIALHGLDAWHDSSKGRRERHEVGTITGESDVGVRMHWLYFDEQAPMALDKAGFSYDSTMGYNETIGYRAGTSQAFKPLHAASLLELPLHVMDTALFYWSYLDLPPKEAANRVRRITDNAQRFGGVVTINWHDRSIAPERLWDRFYGDLLSDLTARGPWFATGREAVAWFRTRRSVRFEKVEKEADRLQVAIGLQPVEGIPGLRLRMHRAGEDGLSGTYTDTPLSKSMTVSLSAGSSRTTHPAGAYAG